MQPDKKEEIPLELPEPEEKLLRPPTFLEKNGWVKPVGIITILITTIVLSMLYVLGPDESEENTTPQETQTISHTPTPQITTDPYSNWKTHVSTSGKYSIKYPSGYTLYENISGSPNTTQIYSDVLPEVNGNFRLSITYKSADNKPLQQLIDENKICDQITTQEGTLSTINGEKLAQVYIDTPCGSYPTTIVYTLNNNLLYIISIETQSEYSQIKNFSDQILTTFEFLEPELTICTQDAKECPNGSWVGRTGPNCEFICPSSP